MKMLRSEVKAHQFSNNQEWQFTVIEKGNGIGVEFHHFKKSKNNQEYNIPISNIKDVPLKSKWLWYWLQKLHTDCQYINEWHNNLIWKNSISRR